MPPEMLQALTGYDPDVQKNRAEARQVMQKLGYGPDSRLKIKVSVRDLPYLRDPAVIMIDQMEQVYIDGDLETIDTTKWFPKVMRKDYIVGLTGAGSGPDRGNRVRPIRKSASGWCGRSSGYWLRTVRA
jgi:peptide/nickel transport system substrate-binding protein